MTLNCYGVDRHPFMKPVYLKHYFAVKFAANSRQISRQTRGCAVVILQVHGKLAVNDAGKLRGNCATINSWGCFFPKLPNPSSCDLISSFSLLLAPACVGRDRQAEQGTDFQQYGGAIKL
jgi:hypothetical protein